MNLKQIKSLDDCKGDSLIFNDKILFTNTSGQIIEFDAITKQLSVIFQSDDLSYFKGESISNLRLHGVKNDGFFKEESYDVKLLEQSIVHVDANYVYFYKLGEKQNTFQKLLKKDLSVLNEITLNSTGTPTFLQDYIVKKQTSQGAEMVIHDKNTLEELYVLKVPDHLKEYQDPSGREMYKNAFGVLGQYNSNIFFTLASGSVLVLDMKTKETTEIKSPFKTENGKTIRLTSKYNFNETTKEWFTIIQNTIYTINAESLEVTRYFINDMMDDNNLWIRGYTYDENYYYTISHRSPTLCVID